MNINNSQFKTILDNIPDRNARLMIGNILTGRIVKQVRCMSAICKGRVVANIFEDGRIEPVVDAEGIMWLFASRPRLDGVYGFECMCGNDSRLCDAERGVHGMEHGNPTKAEIETVFVKLGTQKKDYPLKKGMQEIDNFIIEQL